jgi:hypothetical protein
VTQEEYESKVQSMPHELQNQFRQSLEINLSKRIVNRFMSDSEFDEAVKKISD